MGWCALVVSLQKVGASIFGVGSVDAKPQCRSRGSFEINFQASPELHRLENPVENNCRRGKSLARNSLQNNSHNGCFEVFERLESRGFFNRLGPGFNSGIGPSGREGQRTDISNGPPVTLIEAIPHARGVSLNEATSHARGGNFFNWKRRHPDSCLSRVTGDDQLRSATALREIETSGRSIGVSSGGGLDRQGCLVT